MVEEEEEIFESTHLHIRYTYTELLRRDVEPPSTTVVELEEDVLDEPLPSRIQSCRSAS